MKKIKKILAVDDDVDLLEQTKILLEAKGYEVLTVDNAKEAYTKFEEYLPDACLLDLMMEEHDSGFVLSYQIKKHPHGKNIPVIMLTAATYATNYKFDVSTSEEKEWLKVDELLNKPINIDELVEKFKAYEEKGLQ
jgi:two-component system alkaline phosphatase synthesis response regulator PhoP